MNATTARPTLDERIAQLASIILATDRQTGNPDEPMSGENALAEARRRLAPEPEAEMPTGWTHERLDRATRAMYEARAMSPRPMSDDAWLDAINRSPSLVRMCREDVIAQIEAGDFDAPEPIDPAAMRALAVALEERFPDDHDAYLTSQNLLRFARMIEAHETAYP